MAMPTIKTHYIKSRRRICLKRHITHPLSTSSAFPSQMYHHDLTSHCNFAFVKTQLLIIISISLTPFADFCFLMLISVWNVFKINHRFWLKCGAFPWQSFLKLKITGAMQRCNMLPHIYFFQRVKGSCYCKVLINWIFKLPDLEGLRQDFLYSSHCHWWIIDLMDHFLFEYRSIQ